jgi:hypothetical protein
VTSGLGDLRSSLFSSAHLGLLQSATDGTASSHRWKGGSEPASPTSAHWHLSSFLLEEADGHCELSIFHNEHLTAPYMADCPFNSYPSASVPLPKLPWINLVFPPWIWSELTHWAYIPFPGPPTVPDVTGLQDSLGCLQSRGEEPPWTSGNLETMPSVLNLREYRWLQPSHLHTINEHPGYLVLSITITSPGWATK